MHVTNDSSTNYIELIVVFNWSLLFNSMSFYCLNQWFPTGVPQRNVRGVAKFGSTAFLLMFYYTGCRQIAIFKQQYDSVRSEEKVI